MTEARWQRVCDLFAAALECPDADRQEMLVRECAKDVELRDEVNRLLTQDAGASRDQFLAIPEHADDRPESGRTLTFGSARSTVCSACGYSTALGNPADVRELLCVRCGSSLDPFPEAGDPAIAWKKGSTLGRFELIETVGSGAFGTVYKARDPQLDREVALKVLRVGHLATDADRSRFFREARSCAQLRYPAPDCTGSRGRRARRRPVHRQRLYPRDHALRPHRGGKAHVPGVGPAGG